MLSLSAHHCPFASWIRCAHPSKNLVLVVCRSRYQSYLGLIPSHSSCRSLLFFGHSLLFSCRVSYLRCTLVVLLGPTSLGLHTLWRPTWFSPSFFLLVFDRRTYTLRACFSSSIKGVVGATNMGRTGYTLSFSQLAFWRYLLCSSSFFNSCYCIILVPNAYAQARV